MPLTTLATLLWVQLSSYNLGSLTTCTKRTLRSPFSFININMFATVDESIKEQRLMICYSCDSFKTKLQTCNECKCYMPAKALFAETECPKGKWTRAEPGESIINSFEESILNLWDKS